MTRDGSIMFARYLISMWKVIYIRILSFILSSWITIAFANEWSNEKEQCYRSLACSALSLFRLCNKMGSLRRCRDFFLPVRISDSAKRRAENRSARSSPSNTLVIPNGRRAVMNVSGDSRQRGMPPATNNAALFIGTAFNPRVSVCASVTFRRRRYWKREGGRGERETKIKREVTTPLARNSFHSCPIQPIAFFVLRGMPLVRSYMRESVDYASSDSGPTVLRRETFGN